MLIEMKQDDRKKTFDRQIDATLRRLYQQTVTEDIPDRFHDLLRKLREKGQPE